ncbi:MAG: phosphatase PAP2 family protein [Acidimicrobiaceae bacterium]|nr:phosphatase PAP2 family protein [Acidimicrobiaceae bacterium]
MEVLVDTRIFRWVNQLAVSTPALHASAAWYAVYGIGLFALVLLVTLWWARAGSPRALASALWAGVGTIVVVGLNQIVVAGVHRLRPYWALSHVEVLVARTHDFSFPSDHAVTAGAVAAGVWLVARRMGSLPLRRLALVTILAALLLAADRIYVGVHYPGDVVAGLAEGALLMVTGEWLSRRPLEDLVTNLRRSRLRVLVQKAS